MATMLAKRWWIYAIRGVAGIAFGVLTFMAPVSSLLALVVLFGAWMLVNGIFTLVLAMRAPRGAPRWGALIFEGLVSLFAGGLTLAWPRMSALVLLTLIAVWAVVTGVSEIIAAVRLRKQITGEWLLALEGALTVAFGLMVFLFPAASAVALAVWIGAFAIVFGIVLVALAFRLRAWGRSPERQVPTGGGLHVPA